MGGVGGHGSPTGSHASRPFHPHLIVLGVGPPEGRCVGLARGGADAAVLRGGEEDERLCGPDEPRQAAGQRGASLAFRGSVHHHHSCVSLMPSPSSSRSGHRLAPLLAFAQWVHGQMPSVVSTPARSSGKPARSSGKPSTSVSSSGSRAQAWCGWASGHSHPSASQSSTCALATGGAATEPRCTWAVPTPGGPCSHSTSNDQADSSGPSTTALRSTGESVCTHSGGSGTGAPSSSTNLRMGSAVPSASAPHAWNGVSVRSRGTVSTAPSPVSNRKSSDCVGGLGFHSPPVRTVKTIPAAHHPPVQGGGHLRRWCWLLSPAARCQGTDTAGRSPPGSGPPGCRWSDWRSCRRRRKRSAAVMFHAAVQRMPAVESAGCAGLSHASLVREGTALATSCRSSVRSTVTRTAAQMTSGRPDMNRA